MHMRPRHYGSCVLNCRVPPVSIPVRLAFRVRVGRCLEVYVDISDGCLSMPKIRKLMALPWPDKTACLSETRKPRAGRRGQEVVFSFSEKAPIINGFVRTWEMYTNTAVVDRLIRRRRRRGE